MAYKDPLYNFVLKTLLQKFGEDLYTGITITQHSVNIMIYTIAILLAPKLSLFYPACPSIIFIKA